MADFDKTGIQQNEVEKKERKISRRSALKALAGIPVAGLFGAKLWQRVNFEKDQKLQLIRELGLEDIKPPASDYGTNKPTGALIRIGIIGFGTRGTQLSSALGFLHPDEVKKLHNSQKLANILSQEYLNVAITGVCDVFDLHAENGLIIAKNSVHPNLVKQDLPVKRYSNYLDMLADKNIDAVVISTPDHWHAKIAIDAVKAGKHIYLEKSVAHTEEELNELYQTVRNSNITFQLGHQVTQNTVFQQGKEIIQKNILGKITLIETTSNRNTASGAWIRHLDSKGNPKPGSEQTIDWKQWLGPTPYVPFSIDRFYNWTKWFAYDTGMIGQLFTHEFDAVNQLMRIGIPSSVMSSGGIYYWKDNREMPDSLHCVFEYPDKDLTLMYSGNLASSRSRGRVFMGHDASMELGNNIKITIDSKSTQFKKGIKAGIIETSSPVLSFNPNAGKLDAVSSASEKYFASRGLSNTSLNGRNVDVTHLHIREWINCIRDNKTPSANIEMAFEEGVACLMAHKSYVEKRRVTWDPIKKKIV